MKAKLCRMEGSLGHQTVMGVFFSGLRELKTA